MSDLEEAKQLFCNDRYAAEATGIEILEAAPGHAKCALRFVQTLSDGVTNYWEFYPVSANRVVVLVKNGSGASPGARFVIWGTAFQDIANGYLHLMKGEPFDYDQRYE